MVCFLETGDWRQEIGNRRLETGDERWEIGDGGFVIEVKPVWKSVWEWLLE
jgi:hypothetical protein